MKWPFVSRREYERVQRLYGDENVSFCQASTRAFSAECEAKRERDRYDALLDKYHALKLNGATIPEPVVTAQKKEPDPLVQTINVLSAGKPGLRAQMMAQLAADRRNPLMDDADILQRIQQGNPAYEEGVPV
jgi:hypothetical protein